MQCICWPSHKIGGGHGSLECSCKPQLKRGKLSFHEQNKGLFGVCMCVSHIDFCTHQRTDSWCVQLQHMANFCADFCFSKGTCPQRNKKGGSRTQWSLAEGTSRCLQAKKMMVARNASYSALQQPAQITSSGPRCRRIVVVGWDKPAKSGHC